MPQTIDLTGLPPEVIHAVETLVKSLREKHVPEATEENPLPFRGMSIRYDDPFEPVAQYDWDAAK